MRIPAVAAIACFAVTASPCGASPPRETNFLPRARLSARHFGGDAPWYERNIPFFACSDPQIERIYYYRWKLYKSHLRDLGARGYLVTEFLDDVSWSLKPEESLNDASSFHIGEGRWLRDSRYVENYIDFLYRGGNDRHFSEAIADASYRATLVSGDPSVALRNLAEMKKIYRAWDDRYDQSMGLYSIEPLLDATEYTISSVDASGGKDGFRGGDAFRPSINSFQYANALAIGRLSARAGDAGSAREFAERAAALRERVQKDLWNEEFHHFVDRYKTSNRFVRYGDFIRGRELAGYTPWYFALPDEDERYIASWRHLLAPDRLGGPFGLRTVEPSYQYYKKQYRYVREGGTDKPECQWNGPSWPFQTTLALGGMANVLQGYPKQSLVTADEYIRLLGQYAAQHFDAQGEPDLQEDYDPDTGKAVVGLSRSHHYNHSGFDDLVITGLAGLRPRADDVLEVNPLIPTGRNAPRPISYFCLENVLYHGRNVTILYDRDGKQYRRGAGLSVYVDGKQVVQPSPPGKKLATLPEIALTPQSPAPANLAVNLRKRGFPAPSASAEGSSSSPYQAIDGRVWFYPNVRNYWTNVGSKNKSDWYGVEFERPDTISSAKLYFYDDGQKFKTPERVAIQYRTGSAWATLKTVRPVKNGETEVSFAPVQTSKLRAVFTNPKGAAVALVELKIYGARAVAAGPRDEAPGATGLPTTLEGLESENSHTGALDGMRWRDATNGGFFAFSLGPVPSGDCSLIVTYWGSDAGNRRFTVLVDGVKVGEQTLENNRPGAFFDIAYSLPAALTKGKANVTVRFQALLGATAGGVFGARLAKI